MMHRVLFAAFATALCACVAIACTTGTTPDCSTVKCGPDIDGSVTGDVTVDAPGSDAADAAAEANDAPSDAPTDAPSDG
jgi:hypothetical protein